MMVRSSSRSPGGEVAARQHVQALGVLGRPGLRHLHQHLDHLGHGLFPAVLEGVLEVRGGDIDQGKVGELRILGADQLDIAIHVVTLGLGHAGGTDADNLRLGAIEDIEHRLFDIFQPAEHGRHLAHGRGLQRNGFLEVAHEQHQAKRGAALRAVQQRHAAPQPHEGERAADRLAHLQRIDRAGLFGGNELRHVVILTRPPPGSRAHCPHSRWTECHPPAPRSCHTRRSPWCAPSPRPPWRAPWRGWHPRQCPRPRSCSCRPSSRGAPPPQPPDR